MTSGDSLLTAISGTVADLDVETAERLTREALAAGLEPIQIIERGLRPGIEAVGDSYSRGESFLPELMMAARVMQGAIDVLKPEMAKAKSQAPSLGRVVMGTIAGDLHDLGKNLVISLLELAGFEVFDLGVDVPSSRFVQSVSQHKPHVVGMSALMSTTLQEQERVVQDLTEAGQRSHVKVIVGGAAVTSDWAKHIGADGYSDNAVDAVAMVKRLLEG